MRRHRIGTAMTELDDIHQTPHPATVKSLRADLHALGVARGDVVIVHPSLRAIGWVVGGAAAVVDALCEAVGPEGTVTMPAHSGDWSDPSHWANPPVPAAWWPEIRAERPAFDPYATPLREMGAVAENLLMRRTTLRSDHPLHSHMANGRHAELITRHHRLADSFGDRSPLGRLYELDAKVLLIGVGHAHNTSLHLAESRAVWPGKRTVEETSRVIVEGTSQTVTWSADEIDAEDFDELGEFLDGCCDVVMAPVGQAPSRLMHMRAVVDAAVPWLVAHRGHGRSS